MSKEVRVLVSYSEVNSITARAVVVMTEQEYASLSKADNYFITKPVFSSPEARANLCINQAFFRIQEGVLYGSTKEQRKLYSQFKEMTSEEISEELKKGVDHIIVTGPLL